ncbi:MAG TPA: gamma-glutamyltransferase [Opitutaceae bacterium]
MFAPHGVVAASHSLASQAGLAVLQRGGNSIDAAVTAAAVMNLAEPMMTGIGGDMFAIAWIESERRLVGLNASGRAGSLFSLEALRAAGHSEMPRTGAATVTVPGALSGWAALMGVAYRGFRLWELPPNGQGIAALEMLRILEPYDLGAMGRNSADYLHHLVEAKKLTFADLEAFVGDPDVMTVKVERLLDDAFIAGRRSHLDPLHAHGRVEPGSALGDSEATYLAAADADGNMISFINSLAGLFGSGIVVPGTGFALQNRGAGFTMSEGRANTAASGRRPFHTIIPGFITCMGPDGSG